MIDLSLFYSDNLEFFDISGSYDIPKSYYENSDIHELRNVKVNGKVYRNEEDCDMIKCTIHGEMIIPDSISLEDVNYKFVIEYDDPIEENFKNGENLLDIFQFLWENIVLEVPLQFTKVSDLSKFRGDGWKLISEDELSNQNNPFTDLLKDYDKE